ncbi:MAG: glycosyltransferase family 2 protein [Terriglobales bacterium]
MSSDRPRVTVAVPVYNGENYVAEAIDSVLGQSHGDFELIVADNASTDRTKEICRAYAQRDPRVQYHSSEVNRGVYWNFRRSLALARGEYFMWLAHDDKLAPEFLEKCVGALDQDPGAVLSYPKAIDIDERSRPVLFKEQRWTAGTFTPHERFRELIRMDHNCEAIFGLMRSRVLHQIPVFGRFADADRVLLAELSLHGSYVQIPEFLFLHREHTQRATNVYPSSRFQRTAILIPEKAGKIVFPHFRQFGEYLLAIRRSPLSLRERFLCYREMARWACHNGRRMARDLREVLAHLWHRCKTLLARRPPAARRNNA